MKQKIWTLLTFALLALPMMVACGSDDDEGAKDADLMNQAIGTWMCTYSIDSQRGQSYEGLMVGKEVTINKDGTYTSTASSFGYSGTYSIKGNTITAKSSSGSTFMVTVTIVNDNMTWEGTASNGVQFKYVFMKEHAKINF